MTETQQVDDQAEFEEAALMRPLTALLSRWAQHSFLKKGLFRWAFGLCGGEAAASSAWGLSKGLPP